MPERIPYSRPPDVDQADARAARKRALDAEALELKRENGRFYASAAWRALRAAFLAVFPLCFQCSRKGRDTAANTVHHIKERREFPDLAFDWDNLESSCTECHSRHHQAKTNRRRNDPTPGGGMRSAGGPPP